MKRSSTIAVFMLLLLVCLSWCLWWRPTLKRVPRGVSESAKPTRSQTAASVWSAPPQAKSQVQSKTEQMSDVLALTSLTPILFFGRIVDQNGKPVPNAKVRGSAEIVKRWMSQEWDEHYTTTDAQGLFSFSGLHGQSLVIFPMKQGYEFKSNSARFNYSSLYVENDRHRPESSKPIVFTMWKLKGAEPMAHVRLDRFGVPVNGTPTSFDLLTGKKSPSGGDVILKVKRQPEHIQRGQQFDWQAVVEVPNGGITELQDVYSNEAPDQGYAPQVTIAMPANSKDWQSSVTQSFYVKARDGRLYARVTLRITADYEPPPTGVTLEAFVNPSGSRNLEYDPRKQAFVR